MKCRIVQEGDELACTYGTRWAIDEDKPTCSAENPIQYWLGVLDQQKPAQDTELSA